MAKQQKKEIALSTFGHEYDKDLSRVPIKVSPALQALIANQFDLINKVENSYPEEKVFIEQLKLELVQVEEEISSAFATYMQRKEEKRLKRELKKNQIELNPATDNNAFDESDQYYSKGFDQDVALTEMADSISPGLPSERYEQRTHVLEKPVQIDVRRVALGAAIRTLEIFLGRKLSEKEIMSLEKQVESYLN